jgi:hypothetical protein
MNAFDRTKEKSLTMGELAYVVRDKFGDDWQPRTLQRWIMEGRVRKSDKQVILMDGMQLGGHIYSSLEAYERFFDELSQ